MSTPGPPRVLPSRLQGLRRFARLAAIAVMVLGAIALLGWILDLPLLRSVLPGHVAMKANTAIGMLLAGGALLACVMPGRWPVGLSGLASAALMLLGAIHLLEYSSGGDTGLGTLLFDDPDALAAGRPPGRMSQVTAIAFVLAGWLGMEACRSRDAWLVQALGLALLAIGLFSLSAYGYATGLEGGRAAFNPIGLNTAVAVMLLALGWLANGPDTGLARVMVADSFGGELARRTLLPALLLPVLMSYLAQVARTRGLLSEGATITLMAVASGISVAALIWWASTLLDRVERQRRVSQQLRETTLTDALTRIGNRRAFDEAMQRLADLHQRQGQPFCLLMIDLDRFKKYNDEHGHLAGDQALRITGRLLKAALRPGDVAARYGGEEFAVLLPNIGIERAVLVAERILRDFHVADWPHETVTVSIGVAAMADGDSPEGLVARADRALYAAKQAGRDRVARDGGPLQSGE